VAATWTVLTNYTRSVQSVQALTEAAPTLNTDGILLTAVQSIIPVLTAPASNTFTGSGSMLGYYWSDALARWVRAPRSDDTMSDLTGLAEGVLPALPVISGNGRFAWIASGIGVSGGTSITLTLICAALQDGGAI